MPYAVKSILNQTSDDWELIIVDDQSTDNTWDVITGYKNTDYRIHCYKNPNKGANNARNLGISKAAGKYIAFLDDDDVSHPHRFESQANAMKKSKSRFIVSWFDVRDRVSGKIKKINKQILGGFGAGFPSRWMIEKSLLEEVGGFNPKMIAMQEIELSYRLAVKYTFAHHEDVVTTMYHTPNSTSTGERAIRGKMQMLNEVGHLMHPEEKVWWSLGIAAKLYRAGDIKEATTYIKMATKIDSKTFYIKGYIFLIKFQKFDTKILRQFNSKLLKKYSEWGLPNFLKHEIVR